MSRSKGIAVPRDAKKFNPQLLKRLYDAIEMGMTYEHAAKYAGISDETLRQWRAGHFPSYVTEEEKQEFFERFDLAEGQSVMNKMATITAHSAEDWKAAAWMLERRHPDAYGRVIQTVEHSNREGKPLEVNVSSPKIEALLSRLPMDQLDVLVDVAKHIRENELSDVIDVEATPVERTAIEAGVRDEE